MAHVQSDADFRAMAARFKLRDLVKPPERYVREAGVEPGHCVLDFGCGPGSYAVAAAKLAGESGKVYALDVHPLAIESVRRAALRKGLSNVETIRSDGATGLEKESVDLVLLYDVFHALDEPAAVLAELHRVLKPEGILSFTDHHLREADIREEVGAGGLFRLVERGELTYRFVRAPKGDAAPGGA